MIQVLHKYRNAIQNVLIVLLSLSAAFLFLETGAVYRNADSGNLFSSLLNYGTAPADSSEPLELTSISAPVHIAVTGSYGRYGNLTLSTSDEGFSSLGSLLREALGSSGTVKTCREADFRSALSKSSVYYDFCFSLPLPVLAGLVGTTSEETHSARQLLLSLNQDHVKLLFTDGKEFYTCTTAVASASLESCVNSYQLGNAAFAFELEDTESLWPYSLFLTVEQPDYPQLAASNPLSNSDQLLSAFDFNPHTNSRYPESDGTEVIVDGDRTLRIQPDGMILYQSSDPSALQIASFGDSPTAAETVIGCYQLLKQSLQENTGNAALFLEGITQSGNSWTLQFGYQISGTVIQQSSGGFAAEITVTGNSIVSLRLFIRQYLPGEERSLLLPLHQALPIARDYAGGEMNIRYSDDGSGTSAACWFAA